MTIRQHLRTLVALVVVTTLGLALLAVLSLRREIAGRAELNRTVERTRLAARIQLSALEQRRFEKDLFLNARDPERSQSYRARFDEQARGLMARASELRQLSDERDRAQVERLLAAHLRYHKR